MQKTHYTLSIRGLITSCFYQIVFFSAFYVLTSTQLSAAHIIGGEVTYECLGFTNGDPSTNSRRYVFTMRIFRDCQSGGADFDSAPGGAFTASVTLYQGNQTTPFEIIYLTAPVETQVNPNPGNPCLIVPSNVCVEEGLYVFPPIDLPIIDESYHLVYQRCCRNGTISNIFQPGATGASYAIEVTPEAQASCNNSPTFTEYPPAVLCVNEAFEYTFAATDAEGDQLVYELCAPLDGGGNNFNDTDAFNGLAPDPDRWPPHPTVSFLAPDYTIQNPLGPNAITLDPNTGIMTGMPPAIGQFVVGICVSEFRNGTLLSQVRRDFQFNVTQCEATVVAGIEGEPDATLDTYTVNSCGSATIAFQNTSFQQQYITAYDWSFDLPDGSVLSSNVRNPTLTFPGVGQYSGIMRLNPNTQCADSAFVEVNIFPGLEADFSFEYDTCVAEPVVFTDLSTSVAPLTEWFWDFDDGSFGSAQNPEYLFGEPGNWSVKLVITDENNCQDTQTKEVSYFPVPPLLIVAPSVFQGCSPADILFVNLSEPIDDTYTISWDFGGRGTSSEISPSFQFIEPGSVDVNLEVISPIGCQIDTLFEELVIIEPAPTADFTFTPDQGDNFNAEISFMDQSTGAERISWDFNGQGSSVMLNPTFTFRDTGLQVVTLVVTHLSGCQDTMQRTVDIVPKNTFFMPNAFSPNEDGLNDVFYGKGYLVGNKGFNFKVWNRWGALVFQSNDPLEGWRGRDRNTGKIVPAGNYVFELERIDPRGERIRERGWITVVR